MVRKLNFNLTYMIFTPLGLPETHPTSYIENNIVILCQLQLKLKKILYGAAKIFDNWIRNVP